MGERSDQKATEAPRDLGDENIPDDFTTIEVLTTVNGSRVEYPGASRNPNAPRDGSRVIALTKIDLDGDMNTFVADDVPFDSRLFDFHQRKVVQMMELRKLKLRFMKYRSGVEEND